MFMGFLLGGDFGGLLLLIFGGVTRFFKKQKKQDIPISHLKETHLSPTSFFGGDMLVSRSAKTEHDHMILIKKGAGIQKNGDNAFCSGEIVFKRNRLFWVINVWHIIITWKFKMRSSNHRSRGQVFGSRKNPKTKNKKKRGVIFFSVNWTIQ